MKTIELEENNTEAEAVGWVLRYLYERSMSNQPPRPWRVRPPADRPIDIDFLTYRRMSNEKLWVETLTRIGKTAHYLCVDDLGRDLRDCLHHLFAGGYQRKSHLFHNTDKLMEMASLACYNSKSLLTVHLSPHLRCFQGRGPPTPPCSLPPSLWPSLTIVVVGHKVTDGLFYQLRFMSGVIRANCETRNPKRQVCNFIVYESIITQLLTGLSAVFSRPYTNAKRRLQPFYWHFFEHCYYLVFLDSRFLAGLQTAPEPLLDPRIVASFTKDAPQRAEWPTTWRADKVLEDWTWGKHVWPNMRYGDAPLDRLRFSPQWGLGRDEDRYHIVSENTSEDLDDIPDWSVFYISLLPARLR